MKTRFRLPALALALSCAASGAMAQTVVGEDENGQMLPAWFLVEVARDLPRLAERRRGNT